jgi:putative endonuclease
LGASSKNWPLIFFLDKHYTILHRNYHAGHKEIDLIVQKGNIVVFVEVKSAKSKSMGHPAERVTKKKRNNLILAAQQFLIEKNITENDLRFDVVTFLGGKIEHFPSAFTADENN